MTRVRFPSPAPNVIVSGLGIRSLRYPDPCRCPCGSVVEHSLGKGEVARSIRAMGTRTIAVRNEVNLTGFAHRTALVLESSMAKGKFARTKPHVNVGTIGHVD